MAVAAQVMEQVTTPVKIAEEDAPLKMDAVGVDVFYGDKQALFDVSLGIRQNRVTSLIGPSGCGKSTYPALPQPDERRHRHLPGDR